jgi:hypothetical protein
MMTSFRFGTAINCIDGRTQQVIIDHMKQNYDIDRVDIVMFPGADDELFSNGNHSEEIALIRRAVSISIEKHGSQIIAVVGHYDCLGPVWTSSDITSKSGFLASVQCNEELKGFLLCRGPRGIR